ncbi:MAG TPA: sugar phosphate isomerase/epimerase family protein [Flavitalea sp.]|nr:sugar phosphate isomerase/epimerase family protein [Flavitalea sp.]
MQTRRQFIKHSGLLSMAPLVSNQVWANDTVKPLSIGACDWSIGKSSDPAAFEVAKQIGLKGIMVNIGNVANDLHLRKKEVQQKFLQASRDTGVEISSIALAELNQVPYKSDPRTIEWVRDSIDIAKALGAPVVLLAFFENNDLRNDNTGKDEVIRRLKEVMPRAEQMGVTLGIESYLNAQEHIEIIDKVGSDHLKVYYDFRNTADAGYDTIGEFKKLGKHRICELHIKENGFLLGKGTLNWKQVFEAIKEIGYTGDGWAQIEGAIPDGAAMLPSYKHNLAYLQSLL